MSNLEFKELTIEHLPEVLEIYTYYVLNSTATFHIHPLTVEEMKEIVFFDNPKFKSFVIVNDEVICGYVILAKYSKREAFDGTGEVVIYLKNDYKSKGTGSEAVKFIEDYALTQGLHVLIAVICGENYKSIRLFEKHGYVKCAHYKEVGKKFGRLLDLVAYQKIIN